MAVPSGLHEGYELRRPGTPSVCVCPFGPKTTIPPPLSTAMLVPSGESDGFLAASGSPSVMRWHVESESSTRNASLLPRLNAEKTIESPFGDHVIIELG